MRTIPCQNIENHRNTKHLGGHLFVAAALSGPRTGGRRLWRLRTRGGHRTHQAGETYRRHLPWQRHRIHWAVEAHWQPRAQSWHNPFWLDAHFQPANAGRWHRAHHRPVNAQPRHSAHHPITRGLTSHTLATVSTGRWLRSPTWLSQSPRVHPPPKNWGVASRSLVPALSPCNPWPFS